MEGLTMIRFVCLALPFPQNEFHLHLVAIVTFCLYSSDESFRSFPMIRSDSP